MPSRYRSLMVLNFTGQSVGCDLLGLDLCQFAGLSRLRLPLMLLKYSHERIASRAYRLRLHTPHRFGPYRSTSCLSSMQS